MYIAPNTIIKIINNCPLDPTYDHTIFFKSENVQINYFNLITKYTLTEQSYQRVKRGYIRVNYKAEDLYDCNYLAFQNSSFGNKWFYAFIKNVEYVNNVTSEIEFEIDVMQTWHFNYSLEMCYVDREHANTDNVGDNLVPENVEMGDYISDGMEKTEHLSSYSVVVAATFNKNYDDKAGGVYSGLYTGLYFNVFDNTPAGINECIDFIQNAGIKTDGIVSVFLMPSEFVTLDGESIKYMPINKDKKVSGDIDGYIPKNNKLYTHPYNFMYVTNAQGNFAEYCYEYFSGDTCDFVLLCDMSPNPNVILYPYNYTIFLRKVAFLEN